MQMFVNISIVLSSVHYALESDFPVLQMLCMNREPFFLLHSTYSKVICKHFVLWHWEMAT